MTTCPTFDPLLEDLRELERLADPEPLSEGRAVVWVLALALLLTCLILAAGATRAGGPYTRGGAVPDVPGEVGTVVALARGVASSTTEAAETARATGEAGAR